MKKQPLLEPMDVIAFLSNCKVAVSSIEKMQEILSPINLSEIKELVGCLNDMLYGLRALSEKWEETMKENINAAVGDEAMNIKHEVENLITDMEK